jgi:hypothetical protein
MRHLAVLMSALTLAGCATKPPAVTAAAAKRDPCTDGILALYFKDEAATLRPPLSLNWPAHAVAECPGAKFKVIGLPPPSGDSLQGQRAETLVQALGSFGVPRPAFELGDANDQARPVLEILASPAR